MAEHISGTPRNCVDIDNVKSNSVNLTDFAMGFSLVTDGDLKVITTGDQTITFSEGTFVVGMQHSLGIKRVYSTGTTAAGYLYW